MRLTCKRHQLPTARLIAIIAKYTVDKWQYLPADGFLLKDAGKP